MSATTFRALHQPGHPLVLPNVWDAGTARLVVSLGAHAVATTSGGVAWAHGVRDGGRLGAEAQLALAGSLVGAVGVPVTIDVEHGYGDDPSEVAAFLVALARAGVAGVNVEDSAAGRRRDPDDVAALLGTVRSSLADSGLDLFVNLRCDSYLLGSGEGTADVVARCRRYAEAGADGVFLPGLTDLATIREVCSRVDAPVNVMVPAGEHAVADLAAAGVARVSSGTWLAEVALGAVRDAASTLLDGRPGWSGPVVDYGTADALMAG